MSTLDLLNSLNEEQRAAVSAPIGPVLVLAGAGSGKTRVLTHRAAWLILEHGVSPHGLMAVTFTNKAASEMRGRIETLLGLPADALWIGTFHGLSHRMLRRHWREARLPQSFQILDDDDQQRLVRKVIREQKLDEQRWVPREVQNFINSSKDEGRRSKNLSDRNDPTRQQLIRLYKLYEERCETAGVVDFAELMLRSFELLRDTPDLGEYYRERFRHILVDEFQDTNGIQYDWIRQLVGKTGAPFVVGDDDQSIYRWRGARVENMQHFRREYNATVYRLQQNYRSTAVILAAANAVIAKNTDRMGKELWTAVKGGEPIRVYAAFNERDEADFVIDRIREHERRGLPLAAAAVLYRSNAQSRAFEESLMAARIPYRVYGGLRFFERAEIKDALSYLRLTQSRDDDIAFERVVNLPTRGIGGATLDLLRDNARDHNRSLWRAGQELVPTLPGRAAGALRGFFTLIDRLAAAIAELPLHEQVQHVIQNSGLRDHHAREKDNKGEARVENLDELVNAAEAFAAGERRRPLAARLIPRARDARVRRDAGRDRPRLRAAHDPARGERTRVPDRFRRRPRGRPVPVGALHLRRRPAARGAPALLRRPHARDAAALPHARGEPAHLRPHVLPRPVPVPLGAAARGGRRRPSAHLGEPAAVHLRPHRARRAGAGRDRAQALAGHAGAGRGPPDAPRRARSPREVRRGHGPAVRGPGREPPGPRQLRKRRPENPHVRAGAPRTDLLIRRYISALARADRRVPLARCRNFRRLLARPRTTRGAVRPAGARWRGPRANA